MKLKGFIMKLKKFLYKILGIDCNPKCLKSKKMFGHKIYTNTMRPHKKICQFSDHCFKTCLTFSGMGNMTNVKDARVKRTKDYLNNPAAYKAQLIKEIHSIKPNPKVWFRLNTMSDIDFKEVIEACPNHNFYDYTKDYRKFTTNKFDNYYLTFSYDGHNWSKCSKILKSGKNVAVVFKGEFPKEFKTWEVIDGDTHDSRWLDKQGCVVGLSFKGSKARKEVAGNNGFTA